MRALADRQIDGGVNGLVPCGSTGESASLSEEEHDRVIGAVVEAAAGRCPVLAGTGAAGTEQTVARSRRARDAGADGLLVVTPYYILPTQEGLFRHYSAVAEAVELPIVLYNVPKRCGVDLANETVLRLCARYEHVVAVKDASGTVTRVAELTGRGRPDVFAGDDLLTLPMMAQGAVGVISVVANLEPRWMCDLVESVHQDGRQARVLNQRITSLAAELGRFGPNPVPIKTAMAIKGLLAEEFRLPLCPMSREDRGAVEQLLRRFELSSGAGAVATEHRVGGLVEMQ